MSMLGNFLLVDDATIEELLRSPSGVHSLLRKRVDKVEHPVDYLDVDKAWHALHFFLTGDVGPTEPPLDFILAGGEAVGDEDLGYGPPQAMRHRDVVTLASARTDSP